MRSANAAEIASTAETSEEVQQIPRLYSMRLTEEIPPSK